MKRIVGQETLFYISLRWTLCTKMCTAPNSSAVVWLQFSLSCSEVRKLIYPYFVTIIQLHFGGTTWTFPALYASLCWTRSWINFTQIQKKKDYDDDNDRYLWSEIPSCSILICVCAALSTGPKTTQLNINWNWECHKHTASRAWRFPFFSVAFNEPPVCVFVPCCRLF